MNKALLSSNSNEWETPMDLFNELNAEFGFTLDPCCTKNNHLCNNYYTKEDDGLSYDWTDEYVFCNPPYGREIGKWVEKCATEKALSVMLIPARTDTKYFHKWIYNKPNVEIIFLKGRIKFLQNGIQGQSAPFPSMIVVFKNGVDKDDTVYYTRRA